jgi:serine protease Do
MCRAIYLFLLLMSAAVGDQDITADAIPWNEILGPSQGTQPQSGREKVVWEDDLEKALAEARKENRPLFVTLRCLPCKQCSVFDKDVLEGGPELDLLLKQFVTVRLINAGDLDQRLFPFEGFQDLDLSWWGYFLSPDGRVYAIFGGRDEVSDATRISLPALVNTLKRVLAHHYDPRRSSWDIDGPAAVLTGERKTPLQLPGYASWDKRRPAEEKEKSTCVHCHQVNEILRQPAVDAKKFDKKRDLGMWPLPENVGITLDRDDGLLVKKIAADSPAAHAGIKPGDSLAAASDRKLFGQADFRGVLHRGPKSAGSINIHWLRNGKLMNAPLKLEDGWRQTVMDWRMSISQGNIGPSPGGFFPNKVSDDERQQLGIPEKSMAIRPFIGAKMRKAAAFKAGLRTDQTIIAVNGESPPLEGRAFLVWFRMQHEPGDSVTLTVLDKGQKRQIAYTLPAD